MPHKRSSSDLVARFDDLQPFSSSHEVDEYLNQERIECLLCSRTFFQLSNHLIQKHGVSPDIYKAKLGLCLTRGLVGTCLHQKMSAHSIKFRFSENLKKGGRVRGVPPRKNLFTLLRMKETDRYQRSNKIRKERARRKLLESLRHCSPGASMTTVAKLSGFSSKAISKALSKHRDIKAAFMELTR